MVKVQAQMNSNLRTRRKRARDQASSLLTGLVEDAVVGVIQDGLIIPCISSLLIGKLLATKRCRNEWRSKRGLQILPERPLYDLKTALWQRYLRKPRARA